MKKTILLGSNNKFSLKTNKWGFTITGIVFILNGVFQIIGDYAQPIGLILGVIMIPGGIGYIVTGWLSFSEKSKYAPRITFDEQVLLLKNKLSKPPTILEWGQIKRIELYSYQLKFFSPKADYIFPYEANASTSINIKSAIREIAESKHIEVIGG